MILDLIAQWGLDPARCVLVGDQPSDMEAAAAGISGQPFDGGNLLATVLHLYALRIPLIDGPIAMILSRLADQARGSGPDPALADLAIAAARGYTVLTRNLRSFTFLAVPVHDPFASLPAGSK